MTGLGKRRPARSRSGVSGLQERRQPANVDRSAGPEGSHELEIQGLAHDGRGVARDASGKTVFVEGALPGERVLASVHHRRKRFDEAHVREVVEASPARATPPCRHYGSCGGCDLQHLSLESQRDHKREVLRELLARQGIELPGTISLLSDTGEGYRRRARIGVRVDAAGRVRLGFRARHSHRLVDLDDCPVLLPVLSALLRPLREQVESLEAPRHVGHLELLASDDGVTLVVRQLREHVADQRRWRAFAELHRLNLGAWLGRESPRFEWLTAPPMLHCRLLSGEQALTLAFEPSDFLQANEAVNQRMVDTALDWLAPLAPGSRVLDLFAGIGNFSLPLATQGAEVTAVEGKAAMVERLASNAARNDLAVTARQADLNDAEACRQLLEAASPEVLVLDPPRSGAETLSRQLAARPVPRVLYISCDPATLARDAARLVSAGYVVRRGAVADMFAHTSHLESMLLLEHPDSARRWQGASTDG
ncbi:methyltransferase domain-containing protein [Halomonas caseinilytica]|uniref:methyltransferase domain-containing protein n=1 Tax=Halomonas caseinilytica TaxID=438744 RepID=UPI0007E596E3|nr:methyltransferase domain-containing protein [Halomonas caseinilytica]SEM47905.1 23S rRNA m(5)U-1939 methyltransferase [Halomonas caseinilytica]